MLPLQHLCIMQIRKHDIPVTKEAEEAMKGTFIDFDWPVNNELYSSIRHISLYAPPNAWVVGETLLEITSNRTRLFGRQLVIYFTGRYALESLISMREELKATLSTSYATNDGMAVFHLEYTDKKGVIMPFASVTTASDGIFEILARRSNVIGRLAWNIKSKKLYIRPDYDPVA